MSIDVQYRAVLELKRETQIRLVFCYLRHELELELIQSHMAQKPVLRGEVGCACVAREVSVERGGMGKRRCATIGREQFKF